jgi:hypothetical protein
MKQRRAVFIFETAIKIRVIKAVITAKYAADATLFQM